jgi:hypothetical protein
MTTKEERNKSVEAARNSRHDAMRGICIKKDTHPAIRAEWTRLFKVKEEEEKKPGNAGYRITIDMRKRQVLRDDLVIDSWCQQLF